MCQYANVPMCQFPCGMIIPSNYIQLQRSQLAYWHIGILAHWHIGTLAHYYIIFCLNDD